MEWHNKSIKISNLERDLPALESELLYDCYMTVNSFTAPRRNHYQWEYRKKDMLYNLNAFYSDLDFYKVKLSFQEAKIALQTMVNQNQIPQPSLIASSGKGMYALWLLLSSTYCDKETVRLYDNIQHRICDILQPLRADKRAQDACRVLRLPGSYHTEVNKQVEYFVNKNEHGEVIRYGLNDLAKLLSVTDQQNRINHPHRPVTKKQATVEQNLNSPLPNGCLFPKILPEADSPEKRVALAQIKELCALAEKRGGIKKGQRHCFLWFYANRLAVLGVPFEKINDYVSEMNLYGCIPPQESGDVFYASAGIRRFIFNDQGEIRQMSNRLMADRLDVTTEEAIAYGLKSIIPKAERDKYDHEVSEKKLERKLRQMSQKLEMAKLHEQNQKNGNNISRKELAELIGVSPQTITNWKKLMNFPINPRGRPKH
jgi:hypothetical protein